MCTTQATAWRPQRPRARLCFPSPATGKMASDCVPSPHPVPGSPQPAPASCRHEALRPSSQTHAGLPHHRDRGTRSRPHVRLLAPGRQPPLWPGGGGGRDVEHVAHAGAPSGGPAPDSRMWSISWGKSQAALCLPAAGKGRQGLEPLCPQTAPPGGLHAPPIVSSHHSASHPLPDPCHAGSQRGLVGPGGLGQRRGSRGRAARGAKAHTLPSGAHTVRPGAPRGGTRSPRRHSRWANRHHDPASNPREGPARGDRPASSASCGRTERTQPRPRSASAPNAEPGLI